MQDFINNFEITDRDRAILAAEIKGEGFRVVQKVIEIICREFTNDLLNTNVTKDDEIIKKHQVAKTAAQIYQMMVNRINNEVELYVHAHTEERPVDLTEGILDIGEQSQEEF